MNEPITIYVFLLDEGTEVWAPVKALLVDKDKDTYQLLPVPDYDPELEHWEFPPGSLVRARERQFRDGRALVAFELAGTAA